VGDSAARLGLAPRAGAPPHAERRALDSRHPIARHGEAVGKPRDLNTHRPVPLAFAFIKFLIASTSFGSETWRSSRSNRSASIGGSAGFEPTARSMASGNLAGSAVASATTVTSGAGLHARAANTPMAWCG